MFCLTCKSEIPNNSKFCIKCGGAIHQILTEGCGDNVSTDLLNEAYRLLVARNFSAAEHQFSIFLKANPSSSEAHLGILLAELQFDSKEQLPQAPQYLRKYPHFVTAQSCAPPEKIEWYKYAEEKNHTLIDYQQQLRKIAHENFVQKCKEDAEREEYSHESKAKIGRILAAVCLITMLVFMLFLGSKFF